MLRYARRIPLGTGKKMRSFSLSDLSLLQVKIFLAAAEELNFTRAAERCSVTQPTVSRSIEALEKQTGLILFIRERGKMRLTPAGRSLRRDFADALDIMGQGLNRAWELQQGYRNSIAVSYVEASRMDFILEMAAAFKAENGLVKIHWRLIDEPDGTVKGLLSYDTDVAITHLHFMDQLRASPELACRELLEMPLSVFMLKSNPLSNRSSISVSDLKSQKVIFPKESSYDHYANSVLGIFANEGVTPMMAARVSSTGEGVLNLQEDDEVIILNHLASLANRTDCVGVPLENSRSGLVIAMRAADADNPVIAGFVDFAVAYMKGL